MLKKTSSKKSKTILKSYLKSPFTTLESYISSLPPQTQKTIKIYSKKHVNPSNYNHISPPLNIPNSIKKPQYVIEKNSPIFQKNSTIPKFYNFEEIEKIRKSAKIVAKSLKNLEEKIEVGMSGDDGDKLIHEFLVQEGAYPSGVGFMGFPKSVCISPNDVLCHGVPNNRIFEEGDWVNFDATCFYDGYFGDSSLMVQFGGRGLDPEIDRLCDTTQKALYEAIKICKPGGRISDIGRRIEGHGIGEYLHEPPHVHHSSFPDAIEQELKPGMVFTIEPLVCMMDSNLLLFLANDQFSYVSYANPSAQFEHMVLITENGFEVLTLREDEDLNKFN